jgi:hypothetical protein
MPHSQNFRVARGKGEVKIPQKKQKKPRFVDFGVSVAWKLGFLHLSSNYASISHTLHQCGGHKGSPDHLQQSPFVFLCHYLLCDSTIEASPPLDNHKLLMNK